MSGQGNEEQAENFISDQALIGQIAAADPRALEILYQRHCLAILRYLLGQGVDNAQAEEILQDVMLAVWRSAAAFRGESRVRSWLISIARHRVINWQTRQAQPSAGDKTAVDDPERIAADDLPLIEVAITISEQVQIRAAIQQLPAAQRETLELIFYHALSGPEAAQVLGVAHGTIKSRLHRALVTLRHLLEELKISHES